MLTGKFKMLKNSVMSGKKIIACLTLSVIQFILVINIVNGQAKKAGAPVAITKEQAGEIKKQAAELYKTENFKAAIDLYTKLVNFEPENMDYNYKLGMSIVKSNTDRSQAIQYFVKAADKKDAPKDVYYFMGKALLSAGLFDEAVEAFEKYRDVNKGQVNAKLHLEQWMEYCYNAKEYAKNPLDVRFVNPGKPVNSPAAEYAPVSMAVDTVVFFTSNRKGNMGGLVDGFGEIIPDIYISSRIDTVWTKAKNPGININSEFYDISSGMNSNGDKLLIYKEGAEAAGDIYISLLKGKSWQKAEVIDASMETKYLETGACISNDGKRVFFAADMKGTLGGKDIFMIEMKEDKTWSAPVNVGPTVNTKFDEDFPMLWHDGKTLFFSSEGHTSMGGHDIFMTSKSDPAQDWSKPVNIGYPLNTFDDDLYFTLSANGATGYVAGVKKGGLGDLDIWYFKLAQPLLKNAGTLYRASILSPQGLPTKDAVCSVVKESTGEVIGIMEANGPNAEIFVLLPPGNYILKARSPKMGRLEEPIAITGEESSNGISKVLKLQPNPSGKP
jgi:hypothetical protein